MECEKEVPYEIGDTVYLKNHKLNYYQQKKTKCRESIIQNVYPFSNWLYSMETETSATKQTIEKIIFTFRGETIQKNNVNEDLYIKLDIDELGSYSLNAHAEVKNYKQDIISGTHDIKIHWLSEVFRLSNSFLFE